MAPGFLWPSSSELKCYVKMLAFLLVETKKGVMQFCYSITITFVSVCLGELGSQHWYTAIHELW